MLSDLHSKSLGHQTMWCSMFEDCWWAVCWEREKRCLRRRLSNPVGTINVPGYIREQRKKRGCSVEGLLDKAQQSEPHVIKGEKNPTLMKWFSPGVNSSRSCWWLFQLAARIHKAACRGLCFNNVLLYQLIMPLWPMKEERYTFPSQYYLFLLQKGSCWVLKGGFACAMTCSFGKLRGFITY